MDPLLVLLLLMLVCMGAMAPIMLFGRHRHWMGDYSDRPSSLDPPEAARQILDRRYATGEITKERYEAIGADLDRRSESH